MRNGNAEKRLKSFKYLKCMLTHAKKNSDKTAKYEEHGWDGIALHYPSNMFNSIHVHKNVFQQLSHNLPSYL